MVLIIVSKGSTAEQTFLYETQTTANTGEVAREIADIHNLRLQVQRLAFNIRQLIKYGPMKHESQRGVAPESDEKKEDPNADPTGYREGVPTAPHLAAVLERTAAEAEALVSHNQVAKNKVLSLQEIKDAVQNVKGAVMIAYPMGLPEWDVIRHIFEGTEDLTGSAASKDVVEANQAVLWFAGKQLQNDEPLSKAIGKNEKVKIKAKLAKIGQNAPQREPTIDEETKRNMMAVYHKKQQEAKAAEDDDEDQFLNSAWANPKAFRSEASGLGGIRYKPF